MSAIVGERDRLLRSTVPRNINPTAGKSLLLDVDPPAFHQNSAGIPTIPSAKFIATPDGFAGTVLWSITSGGKLTGTTPNQRTLLFSDMTKDSVTVTASIIDNGQAYLRTRTFYKLTDGAPGKDGKDADPANLSPAALAAALEGRITESQLYADLRTRINLIDSPATVLGSVTARVKAETDGRIAAIDKEVQDRIDAIYAKGQAIDAFVRDYTFSKVETNSALAIQASQIAAAYTNAVSAAASDVRTYAYSKSAIDSAEAAQSAALTTSYTAYADAARTAAISTASADVRSYSYAKSATDSAITAAIQQLRSEFVGSSGATEGYVTNYAYSKSQIDQSEAAQTSAITTNYRAYADAARDQAVSTSSADVRQYAYSKSSSDSAISSLASTLRSEFTSSAGVSQATLENYAYSKAQTNSAITQQTSTLVSTVGQHTTAIQQQATTVDGLSAQYTVKIDNNGRVSGFGLASTPVNGVAYSAFIINADAFSVGAPGVANKQMFTVGQVNGQVAMVLRGDMYADGAIKASSLAIGNADQILPDSNMLDSAFWGRPDYQFLSYPNSFWRSTRVLSIGIEPYKDTFTPLFTAVRGGFYMFEFQVFLSGDYAGPSAIVAHLPGQEWFKMGGPNRGYSFSQDQGNNETLPVMFDENSPKGASTFSAIVQLSAADYAGKIQIRVVTGCRRGYIQFGGVRITRVVDRTIIGPGQIFTKHLDIDTGGDIHSGQSGFDLGDGFWLEGEGRGHGARMSIGRQNGRKIIMDPANNRLELVDPQIGLNMTASISPTYFNLQRNANQQFTDGYGGTYTASAGNASGNLSYSWSATSESSYVTANIRGSGSQAQLFVSGKLTYGQSVDVYVSCRITDLNNGVSREASMVMTVYAPEQY